MATINPSPFALIRARKLADSITSSARFLALSPEIRRCFNAWAYEGFSKIARLALEDYISDCFFAPSLKLDEFDRILGLKMEESSRDDENPFMVFNDTHSRLLCGILDGSIDVYALAALELENRGKNLDGRWVGFKATESIDYYEKLK